VFSLEDNERGETDMVQLTIDTGDAPLQYNLLDVYHLQHSKNHVAYLLESMQESGVIQPSQSPWGQPNCSCQIERWDTQALC